MTGENGEARYRVAKVEADHISLDRPCQDADFPDADGDGRRMVMLYEIGSGDEVTLPQAVFVRRTEGGVQRQGEATLDGM